MNQISVAGSGLYIIIITAILNYFGITSDVGTITAVVTNAVTVFGWVLLIIGQLKRKDLTLGLVRK
jgi:hypothetical protein